MTPLTKGDDSGDRGVVDHQEDHPEEHERAQLFENQTRCHGRIQRESVTAEKVECQPSDRSRKHVLPDVKIRA